MRKRAVHIVLFLAFTVAALSFLFLDYARKQAPLQDREQVRVAQKGHPRRSAPPVEVKPGEEAGERVTDESTESAEASQEEESPPPSEEERQEAEEERLVDAFDDLTDKWMEPADKGVNMENVQKFAEQFRKVPKSRKEECLQRALNLIPDENVLLLAGVLMDKTLDSELLELVFNDVLNRGEEVKKPILQQVFKDKSHPCWADTAWILDVTGELPQKKGISQTGGNAP